jgi:hypothetical protein
MTDIKWSLSLHEAGSPDRLRYISAETAVVFNIVYLEYVSWIAFTRRAHIINLSHF